MTESEWEACREPQKMLVFLRNTGKASDRKLRLFAVACLRRISHLFKHEDVRRTLEVANRFAEGGATDEELRAAEEQATWAGDDASWHSLQEATADWAAAPAAHREGIGAASGAVYEVRLIYSEDGSQRDREELAQAVEEMNRYSTQRVEVDPSVASLKVSGVYRVGDNAAFARSLTKLLPIVLHEDGDTLILTADTDP